MTQYNTVNIKLSNSQLDTLKSGIKNGAEVTLKISIIIIGESNDQNNFLHKLLLTNAQFSKLCKAFANDSEANITLSIAIAILNCVKSDSQGFYVDHY